MEKDEEHLKQSEKGKAPTWPELPKILSWHSGMWVYYQDFTKMVYVHYSAVGCILGWTSPNSRPEEDLKNLDT